MKMGERHNYDILIFTPVGLTIAGAKKGQINGTRICNKVKFLRNNKPLEEAFESRTTEPDPHPAEISSLYGFSKEYEDVLKKKKIKVVLLHSPGEGKYCAEGIKNLVEKSTYFPKPNSSEWSAELVELQNLDPSDAMKFPKAIEELFEEINKRIAHFSGDVFVNVTGGYKGLLPYLTMIGMAQRRLKVFYLYEDSKGIIELPTYPISFDLFAWRDQRGLLLPFTLELGLDQEQKKDLYQALKKQGLEGVVAAEPPYPLSALGKTMEAIYEEQRGRGISEFGLGFLLLDEFQDKKWARYLARECIPRWRHLAVGDHIPETVEHGRGHTQRLLELAQQLLIRPDMIRLSDEQLFVLISSIWLHDIGHSGDYFTFEGADGLIKKKDETACQGRFFCLGDPERVRSYHNFLTYELIKSYGLWLFPNRECWLTDLHLNSVALACLYHRKRMPVEGSCVVNENVLVQKGLKDFKEGEEVIQGFPLVAALLRFIDGAENQEERSGSDEYYEVAKWVIERQVEALSKMTDQRSSSSSLKPLICFKNKQPREFRKHRMVRHVFMAWEGPDHGEKNEQHGVFGNTANNPKQVLEVYLIGNCGFSEYDRDEVRDEIMLDLLEEFDKVKDILPFRLLIYLVEEKDNGTTCKSKLIRQNTGKYCLKQYKC